MTAALSKIFRTFEAYDRLIQPRSAAVPLRASLLTCSFLTSRAMPVQMDQFLQASFRYRNREPFGRFVWRA